VVEKEGREVEKEGREVEKEGREVEKEEREVEKEEREVEKEGKEVEREEWEVFNLYEIDGAYLEQILREQGAPEKSFILGFNSLVPAVLSPPSFFLYLRLDQPYRSPTCNHFHSGTNLMVLPLKSSTSS